MWRALLHFWPFLLYTGRRRALGAVLVASAVAISGSAIYQTTNGGGGEAPPGTANIWVDQNGGTCVDNASPVAYNDAQACTWNDANDTCDNGDTVLVKGGTTYGVVEVNGWNSRTNYCDFAPASGENVLAQSFSLGSWNYNYAPANTCNGTSITNSNSTRWFRWTGPMRMGAFQADCAQNISIDGGSGYAFDLDARIWPGTNYTCTGDGGATACKVSPFHVSDGDPSNVTIKHFQVHHGYISNSLGWFSGTSMTLEDGQFFHDDNCSFNECNNGQVHDSCLRIQGDTDMVIRRVRFWLCQTIAVFVASDSTGLTFENNFVGRVCNDDPVDGCQDFHGGGALLADHGTWGPNENIRYNTFRGGLTVSSTPTGSNTIMGNVFLGSSDCGAGTHSYNAFEGGSVPCGTNSINGSYLSSCFVNTDDNPTNPDADMGDYHLNAGCALIGAGNTGDFPATDQDGHTRSSPPSIGAYVSTAQE